MNSNKRHTPTGVSDHLPLQAYQMREIQNRIEAVFRGYGYCDVNSPMFEYIEVFEGMGSFFPRQVYKFIDREGETLALRPDMTPAVARMAANQFAASDMPMRLCYTGNAFRYNESYQGKNREFTQSGVELIGVDSLEANAEVLCLAIRSLLACGLKDFRVDIGQAGFLPGVLEEAGLDASESLAIQRGVLEKDFVAVERAVTDRLNGDNAARLLTELPMLVGKNNILEKAGRMTRHPQSLAALEELAALYGMLESLGLDGYVRFDLGMLGQLDYYTGLIFSGHAPGTGFSVLDGGRYDRLMAQFGMDQPSVGFGIQISEVREALVRIGGAPELRKTEVLIVHAAGAYGQAMDAAEELRRQGRVAENGLWEDLDKNIAYAGRKGIEEILFFNGNDAPRRIVVGHGSTGKG